MPCLRAAIVTRIVGRMAQQERLITPMQMAATSLGIAAVLISGCGQSSDDDHNAAALRNLPSVVSTGENCGAGAEVLRPHEVTITGTSDLYDAPEGKRIVNAEATAVSTKTQYQSVDHTERLEETCRGKGWSQVRVLEPDWLTDVIGWIPTSKIRAIKRDEAGARRYVAADFYWDSTTSGKKQEIVEAVNRALRHNSECRRIDPGTLSTSPSRSKPGRTIYYVTCTEPNGTHNIWFDLKGETVL